MVKDKKDIEDIYPLSDNQITFLLNHIRSGAEDSGQILVKCKLEGDLDQAVFISAWHAVVEKHGSMRSSVHWKTLRKPLQVVHKRAKPQISFLSETAADDNTPRISLALDQQPNHQVIVYSDAVDQHTMHWHCHHIFIDGWSSSVVLKDFVAMYNRISNADQIIPATPRCPQFKDYLDWLDTRDMGAARSHWLKSVKNREYRSDFSYVPAINHADRVHRRQKRLASQITALTHELSEQHGVTPSEIVQSAWAIFLAMLSQSKYAGYLMTLSGRSAPIAGIESLVGQLSTALPVEIELAMDQSLLDVIKKVRVENNTLRNYDYLSLPQLNKWGYRQASLPEVEIQNSTRTLISLVVVENFTAASKTVHVNRGLELASFESGIVSNYPLTLTVLTGNGGMTLTLLGNDNMFAAGVIERMFGAFETLFTNLVGHPDQAVARFRHPVERLDLKDTGIPLHAERRTIDKTIKSSRYRPPETETQAHLQKIWQDIFNSHHRIGIDENYFELGGTSLDVISLYTRIESRFDCKLPISSILEAPTIEKLAALITQQPDGLKRIIVPIQEQGEKLPVFGIHAQDILFYRDISNALGDRQPFYAIQQLDDGGADSNRHTSISEMAAAYIDEIKKIQASGPYTIMGLCLGCTIGHEIVYQLSESGEQVNTLIMFDPDLPQMVFATKRPAIRSLRSALEYDSLRYYIRSSLQKLLNMSFIYRLALLKGRIRIARKSLSGPLEKRRAVRRHHNWILNQKYRPPPYDGKIRIIQSGDYHRSMNRFFYNDTEDFAGSSGIQTAVVEGTHTSIFSPPTVYTTAALVNRYIGH